MCSMEKTLSVEREMHEICWKRMVIKGTQGRQKGRKGVSNGEQQELEKDRQGSSESLHREEMMRKSGESKR